MASTATFPTSHSTTVRNPRLGNAISLPESDARIWLELVADVDHRQSPLPEILRAGSEDAETKSLREALRRTAEHVEQGGAIHDLIERGEIKIPAYDTRLLLLLREYNAPADALLQLMDRRRETTRTWRKLAGAIAYTGLLLLLATVALFFFSVAMARPIAFLENDGFFKVEQLRRWILIARGAAEWSLQTAAAIVVVLLLFRLVAPRAIRQEAFAMIPLVGPIPEWFRTAEALGVLGTLVGRGARLDQSLDVVADGVSNSRVASAIRALAVHVKNGGDPAAWIWREKRLPPSIAPFFRVGTRTGDLSRSLESAGEMLQTRATARMEFVRLLVPSLLMMTSLVVVFCIGALLYRAISPTIYGLSNMTMNIAPPGFSPTRNPTGIEESGFRLGILLAPSLALLAASVYLARRSVDGEFLPTLYRRIGTVFLVISLIGLIFALGGAGAFVVIVPGAIFLFFALLQASRRENQHMVHLMAAATESGVPLTEAARAFAHEQTSGARRRALFLAKSIEEGKSLLQALRSAGYFLDPLSGLAVHFSTTPQSLARNLREAQVFEDRERVARSPRVRFSLYIVKVATMICLVTAFIVGFLYWNFRVCASEMGVLNGPLWRISDAWFPESTMKNDAAIIALTLAVPLAVTLLFLWGMFFLQHEVTWRMASWFFPWLELFRRRYHACVIMKAIHWGTCGHMPMDQILEKLKDEYPARSIRRRLRNMHLKVTNGSNWVDAFRKTAFPTNYECSVLSAANDAGNVSWALDTLAESGHRRLERDRKRALAIATPVLTLALAIPVGLIGWFTVTFLVELVQATTKMSLPS